MDRAEAKHVIEALLFATDVPLSLPKIRSLIGNVDSKILRQLVAELQLEYERDEHSFALVEVAGGYQIYTKPEYAKWVQELFRGKRTAKLTAAALESLAIVAYKQPLIKSDIEVIRGVNVEGVMATLLERNLVQVVGRDPRPGRPLLYGTTPEFLRYFGLSSLSDLPRIEELEEYLKSKEAERERLDAEIDQELKQYQAQHYGSQEEVPFSGQQPDQPAEDEAAEDEAIEDEAAEDGEAGPGQPGPDLPAADPQPEQ
ncbi:MAG TPA: SMC-Scp complex subunit ScpB [Candidatus Edwardsbacteria bacterium]|nr:SMC-Scp complex subunit ScpB [Candidatus Edwardsbacteria bacterium]